MSELELTWEFMKTPQYIAFLIGTWLCSAVIIYQIHRYKRWRGRYSKSISNRCSHPEAS